MEFIGHKLFADMSEDAAQSLYASLKIKRDKAKKGQIVFVHEMVVST